MGSCFFIGHRETPDRVYPTLLETIERHITEYGVSEFVVGQYGNFDRLVIRALSQAKRAHPDITVTWQTYNRGGVLYGSYDEMFISLLPRKVENPELKRILRDYFRIRSEKVKVEESITVYKDATERFGD